MDDISENISTKMEEVNAEYSGLNVNDTAYYYHTNLDVKSAADRFWGADLIGVVALFYFGLVGVVLFMRSDNVLYLSAFVLFGVVVSMFHLNLDFYVKVFIILAGVGFAGVLYKLLK